MQIFISADSGPAHLAASLNIPTIVLFGPTSEKITGPKGRGVRIIRQDIDCQIPCYKTDCKDNYCMTRITPDRVVDEVKRQLLV